MSHIKDCVEIVIFNFKELHLKVRLVIAKVFSLHCDVTAVEQDTEQELSDMPSCHRAVEKQKSI